MSRKERPKSGALDEGPGNEGEAGGAGTGARPLCRGGLGIGLILRPYQ